jgi:hypothetical protein
MDDPVRQHDQRRRRCPMLGHEVPFSYCRQPGSDIPCRKILDCWFETFDVRAFVTEHLPPETLERISAPRPDKAASLVDLIRQARQRTGQLPENDPPATDTPDEAS